MSKTEDIILFQKISIRFSNNKNNNHVISRKSFPNGLLRSDASQTLGSDEFNMFSKKEPDQESQTVFNEEYVELYYITKFKKYREIFNESCC